MFWNADIFLLFFFFFLVAILIFKNEPSDFRICFNLFFFISHFSLKAEIKLLMRIETSEHFWGSNVALASKLESRIYLEGDMKWK